MTFAAMNSVNGRRLVAVLARSANFARVCRLKPGAPRANRMWTGAQIVPAGWLLDLDAEKDAPLLRLAALHPPPKERPGSLMPPKERTRKELP